MVSSLAGSARGLSPARDVAGPPGHAVPPGVGIVGHAGLAIGNGGGCPTRHDLDRALGLGVDRLELDLCCTTDGHLVLRHDLCLRGRPVAELDLATLLAATPGLLTLDDAVEHIQGRVPLLLDLKTARSAEMLGVWLRRRRDLGGFAACTENLPWLLHLRFAAPRLARWPSFPDLGDRRSHHLQRVVHGLWRSHTSLGGLRRGAGDIRRAARQLPNRPAGSLAQIGGLPWRRQLPADIERVSSDLAPAGLCVHHWVVSEGLVTSAHQLGLHVNAWTVNDPFASRAVWAAGVDSITTDRVELVRFSLEGLGGPATVLMAEERSGRS